MKIRDLPLGTKFRYEFGRTATLISLGPCGARIKYDRDVRHEVFVAHLTDGDKEVEFHASGRPVLVSDASEVEILRGPA